MVRVAAPNCVSAGRALVGGAMSTPIPEATAQPAPAHGRALRRHVEEFVLILLLALSALGVAINDYSPKSALRYWVWMGPTFGVISIAAAWWRAHRHRESVALAVQRQALHWLGATGAVYL